MTAKYAIPPVSGLNINQSFKLLMLISQCHLNVNVDAKNEKPLSRHSGMLLSRINSFQTNLSRAIIISMGIRE